MSAQVKIDPKTGEQLTESYDAYADAIFRHVYFRVSDRDLAKDLVASTFAKVWEYLAKGGKIENMKAFLYKTATNLVIDEYRKKGAQSLDELIEEGYEPKASAGFDTGTSAEVGELVRGLARIPEPYREVVALRYIDELSPQEIADIKGLSPNAVSVRINRGVAMLRKEMHI
jgi:RNA polymerase sigma-70 factor (ECF subfamily)